MTKLDDKHDPGQLYRRYQEARDNIPLPVLKALCDKAEFAHHENAIHTITQMAKTANSGDGKTAPKKSKPAWFEGIISKFSRATSRLSPRYAPQLGMAFACLAVAAVILPLNVNFDNTTTNYAATAHLNDCLECDGYIANASVITRGVNARGIDAQLRQAARLGKLSGKLKVLAARDPNRALNLTINDLGKLPTSALSPDLIALRQSAIPSLSKLDELLTEAASDKGVFHASEALFVANIFARRALDTNKIDGLKPSITRAVIALESLSDLSLNQKRRLSELRPYMGEKVVDQALITAIEAVSASLGG